MKSKINQREFFLEDSLLSGIPNNFVHLNDEDEFENNEDIIDDTTISDDEFNNLLNELGISVENTSQKNDLTFEEEKEKFRKEKEFEYTKIQLERDILESEKAKFEKEKLEWEENKKLSEENFRLEKEEWEKQKRTEQEKIYLETKEIINSCNDFKRYLENYSIIQDVSE